MCVVPNTSSIRLSCCMIPERICDELTSSFDGMQVCFATISSRHLTFCTSGNKRPNRKSGEQTTSNTIVQLTHAVLRQNSLVLHNTQPVVSMSPYSPHTSSRALILPAKSALKTHLAHDLSQFRIVADWLRGPPVNAFVLPPD